MAAANLMDIHYAVGQRLIGSSPASCRHRRRRGHRGLHRPHPYVEPLRLTRHRCHHQTRHRLLFESFLCLAIIELILRLVGGRMATFDAHSRAS